MHARDHNLIASYYRDASTTFHYNDLKCETSDLSFRVVFTRHVTPNGIAIHIESATANETLATSDELAYLANEVKFLQENPLTGDECVACGWTYLGHLSTSASNITAAVIDVESKGYKFKSLFYAKGYFVYGCAEMKLFYDAG